MARILIIKLGAIGDVLRTTGFLPGLFAKYPGASITWITEPISVPLFEGNTLVKRVLTPSDWQSIKDESFDLVISLDDEEGACRIASEATSKRIIGAYVDSSGKRTYTPDSAPWFAMGLLGGPDRDELKKANTRTYQSILQDILGISGDATPLLFLGEKEKAYQNLFRKTHEIAHGEKLIGINTGAGGRWQYKKLSEEKTARLIDTLTTTLAARCVLLGGPEERERNARIASLTKSNLIDAGCDHTLREFASIIGLCDLLVSSDSLAMHMAIALRKKVIVFFGPTSAAEIELFGRGEKITPPMTCLVCYKRRCDFNPACMDLITVDMLAQAAEGLLA